MGSFDGAWCDCCGKTFKVKGVQVSKKLFSCEVHINDGRVQEKVEVELCDNCREDFYKKCATFVGVVNTDFTKNRGMMQQIKNT